jgi:iron complex outermembrane receptor protein
MKRLQYLKSALAGGASVMALVHPAAAKVFDIPDGDLSSALVAYMKQSDVELVYADNVVRGHKSRGARGDYTESAALTQILRGTGFTMQSVSSSAIGIVPEQPAPAERLAQAARRAPAAPIPAAPATIETVVVTAQKKKEDIQQVPIAITALSQKELTERQIASGPDLVKEVPNLTFSKTNFSGYNLEIRGIGTQAISVTTDPAVAVAFNDIPFIRNHFFEQEFFDLDNLEVLRGPQGTLYGRNATAGVVNIISAKPTDTYEAMLSADIGNYSNRRYEAMLNLPIVGDTFDIRFAGEWTKRDGYSFNDITDQPIDGRDLWSGRMTIGWKPTSDVQTYLVWEHFSEDDDRLRSGKQLCTPVPMPTEFEGVPVGEALVGDTNGQYLSQGCSDGSLYSPAAYGVPPGYTLPYWAALNYYVEGLPNSQDPYAGTTQSTNLRVISSELNPTYRAKNDTLEFNANWNITPQLTLTSQTGYNHDFLWSTEDYDRFATRPDVFDWAYAKQLTQYIPGTDVGDDMFCDPQLGCANRLEAEDLSEEHAWQLSQEFRLASNFNGPLNFSFGGNFLHYETEENYYVFINTLTLISVYKDTSWPPQALPYQAGVSTSSWCLKQPHQYTLGGGSPFPCNYIDPNPIGSLNNQGHNYFLSQNPYVLNSYASFGEVYYDVTNDFKLTAGGRWTEDQKHFIDIPSEILTPGYGYPIAGVTDQQWDALTGRLVADWTPDLDFTDKTLIYASIAHGYKAGGANPPGAELLTYGTGDVANPIHPPTFKPEYIQSFELGTKNTALDNSLTINGDIFYYNYTGYQISEIVDRSAINLNFNAHIEGAELETNWEPLPGLKFSLAQGFESTALAGGSEAVDLMDRTGGLPGWSVVRPFITQASNCILPNYVIAELLVSGPGALGYACGTAYSTHLDPATGMPYVPLTGGGYPGFNPLTAPNNGEGFDKDMSGNQLPNAPHFTSSLTAEYSMPVSDDWVATLHADFYWQSQQWARVFEDPIDKIHGYSTTNLALILNSANGWQVMAYVKNVFDVTAITGTFLNSDDTDLTTNVFLTDPRLFGIRVTKQLDEADGFWGSEWTGKDFFTGLFSDTDNGKPPLWIELGGMFDLLDDGQQKLGSPFFADVAKAGFDSPLQFEHAPATGIDESAKVSFTPDGSDWTFTASVRYGRNGSKAYRHQQTNNVITGFGTINPSGARHRYAETTTSNTETHDIFDFMAGKDVGLGVLGMDGTSILSGGLRFVQFRSTSGLAVYSDPDYNHFPPDQKYFHNFSANARNKESFTGIGPAISWDASTPLSGETQNGQISFDWGSDGAVLFGRQKSRGNHQTMGKLSTGANFPPILYYHTTHYTRGGSHNRSRVVTVPNLGAMAGFSFHYANAKVSFGYRIDEFFGAMDGGIDAHKSDNFGDSGPFANISIGIGG